ncbi:MAG TPA: ABC transporter ATP-binding protein [Candidatus Paceibacterota bacterium]|nr:ABC transporter ATP-binding protein [Candidatus Paceibacterota bacterium]
MSNGILKTQNLKKHFGGIYVTNDLSLEFPKGKIIALIGPNGSGKSTLINLLSGMFPFDDGQVITSKTHLKTIESSEIAGLGITRTFQEVRVFEQMTVMDNILVVLTERGVFQALFEKNHKAHITKAEEILKKVDLYEKRNDLAINLSYGQRKLLEVARVLAMHFAPTGEPEIIFFDEPYAGLFPQMIETIKTIMLELQAGGKTIVLVEHNMDIIRELCDYCIVLDEGKLLAEGETKDVLKRSDVMEAYLGE